MANIKQIIMDYSVNGLTVYCIVRRERDGYLLDDADGSFGASPTDYLLSMPEDNVINGRYEVDESRTVWTDGLYTVAIYKQVGASPSRVADTMIGDGEIIIESDTEVTSSLSSLPWSGTTSVSDILDNVLGRVKTAPVDIFTAINDITNLIFKRLWKKQSDLVTSELTAVLAAGNSALTVPGYFRGVKRKPSVVGETEDLEPLYSGGRTVYRGVSGTPEYYELRQGTIYVFPTPEVLTTIKCEYFRDPGKVTALTDIVPFAGMFDSVYTEGIVNFAAQGISLVSDSPFAKFLDDEIDLILPARSRALPTRRPVSFF